jgi:16S rRNA (guanine1207-N2)-methyltransferase
MATGDPHLPAPARAQEQLLIDLLPELSAGRVLCTSAGVGQFAVAAARQFPPSTVHCHYLDLYQAEQARQANADMPENLSIGCAADFPPAEVDLVALPLSAHGEAELARDLLQAGHQLLCLDGQLLASTDNRGDRWLQEEMKKLFGTVTRRQTELGAAYLARKQQPLRKIKDFTCQFAFRDHQRLIRAASRPGVFAHRRIDPGARQVLNHMEVQPGEKVLDIGCGSGVLALAAACRAEGVSVHAVDSHARAVQCTARGAELNGLLNITTELNASGEYLGQGTYQVVLANPPYYAAFQIARRFLLAGRASLEPGGRILVVTKSPQWYQEHMPQWFDAVTIEPSKDYFIVNGQRPG